LSIAKAPAPDRLNGIDQADDTFGVSARTWRVYAGLGLLGIAAYYLVPSKAAQDVLYSVIGASTAVAIVVGVRANRPRIRSPWYLLVVGQLLFVAGDIVWNVMADVLHTSPFPSAADGLYLAGYPLFAIGLLGFVRCRIPGRDRASLIDALIIGSAVAVIAWVFWIDRYADQGRMDSIGTLISMAYPAMDVVLIAVLARLAVSPGSRVPAYRFLMSSLVLLLLADVLYANLEVSASYNGRSVTDAAWLLSYVALGAAALHSSMRSMTELASTPPKRLTRRRLALLAIASLTTPAVFGIQELRGRHADGPIIVFGSVALFLLVLARIEGLIREVESSVHELEGEHATLHDNLVKEREAAEELRDLARMKGDFVALVSHELRTPRTTIIGFAKALQQRAIAEDPVLRDESVRAIARQGHRLLRLVENLLTAARLQSKGLRIRLGPLAFAELCAEVVEGMQPGADRIRLAIPPDLPILLTDRELLGRVLANLLDNALKYSPNDSTCEVEARRLGRWLEFSVQDQGIGIPPSQLGHIFDRFYQVDSSPTRKYMGVGLGLSLVRDLVRDLGGSLAVASRKGEGSTFTVRVPIRHPLAASDDGDEQPKAVAGTGG